MKVEEMPKFDELEEINLDSTELNGSVDWRGKAVTGVKN